MKKIHKYIILIFITFIGVSCDQDEFFKLQREAQYPWKSADELELGVRTPYWHMNREPWNTPYATLALKSFTESDIAVFLPQFVGGSNSEAYYNREFSDGAVLYEMEGAFDRLCQMATSCNGPLKLIEDAEEAGEEPFPDMTEADKEKVKQFKGELLFMRGVTFWHMVRIWAPPFDPNGNNDGRFFVARREFTNSVEELKDPTLASVAEVYAGIEEDLTMAKSLLVEDPSSLVLELNVRARASKFAASAMLMRLYFITGQYDKAESECDYIINNGSGYFDLTEDPIEAFNKNGIEGWGSEVIWQLAYSETSGSYGRMESIYGRNHYSKDKQSSWSSQAISHSALKQVGWMDEDLNETEEALNDKRYQQIYYRYDVDPRDDSVEPMVWSYKFFRASNARRSNRPLIRLAEIYLTRSILRFNNNDKDGAASDLNVVRNRAGLDNINAGDITAEDIHNERIKEMATEVGDRMYYLIGLQEPLGIGDRDPSQFSPVQPPYSEYYWKVPLVEREQNQAYQ